MSTVISVLHIPFSIQQKNEVHMLTLILSSALMMSPPAPAHEWLAPPPPNVAVCYDQVTAPPPQPRDEAPFQ